MLLLLAALLAGLGAHAQQGPPLPLARVAALRDSIGRLLATERQPDTVRVNRLNVLAFALRTNDAPQSLALTRQALALARQLGYQRGLLGAQFDLAYYFRAHNQYDSAVYYSRRVLALATRLHDVFNQTRAYYNLSRSYYEQGDYAAALGPSLDGLALAHRLGNPRAELFQLVLAARIELDLGEEAEARRYVAQARRLLPRVHDLLASGYVCAVLGDLARQQGQWLTARRYYQQALASYGQVYNARGLLPTELSVADMTDQLGEHPAARQAAAGLLRRARATGTPEQVAQAAGLLARTWLPTSADSARRYARLSLDTARPRHLLPQAREAARLLAQASDQLSQGHAAYQYQLQATAYADSLTGEASRRRVAAVQARDARSQLQARLQLQAQQQELTRLRYQRLVLALAAGLVLVLAVGLALLRRYRRRAAQRLHELRTRIAADLHDEVGSMLTQLAMQSTLVRTGTLAPPQQQAYLDQMVDASRRAGRQLSDAVWSIDARHDSMASLLERLRDHAHQVLPPAGLDVEFATDPALLALTVPLATRQALYTIYKEALHNVVKHARARQVEVRVALAGAWLELAVRDDGPPAPLHPRPGGQGLPNMQQRAAAVGGTAQLLPAQPGPGAVLLARLPL